MIAVGDTSAEASFVRILQVAPSRAAYAWRSTTAPSAEGGWRGRRPRQPLAAWHADAEADCMASDESGLSASGSPPCDDKWWTTRLSEDSHPDIELTRYLPIVPLTHLHEWLV